jgi:hypothetical protein
MPTPIGVASVFVGGELELRNLRHKKDCHNSFGVAVTLGHVSQGSRKRGNPGLWP